jgi:hypothetical protein
MRSWGFTSTNQNTFRFLCLGLSVSFNTVVMRSRRNADISFAMSVWPHVEILQSLKGKFASGRWKSTDDSEEQRVCILRTEARAKHQPGRCSFTPSILVPSLFDSQPKQSYFFSRLTRQVLGTALLCIQYIVGGILSDQSGLSMKPLNCFLLQKNKLRGPWRMVSSGLLRRENLKSYSVALSHRANYTDWSTATCRRNLAPTIVDRGVSRGQRGGSPTIVNLS